MRGPARSLPVPRGRGAPALGIPDSLPPSRGGPSGDTEYYGVDKRSERSVTPPDTAFARRHVKEHRDAVEHRLEFSHQMVSATRALRQQKHSGTHASPGSREIQARHPRRPCGPAVPDSTVMSQTIRATLS